MPRTSWLIKLIVPAAIAFGGAVLYCIVPEKTWWMPPCLFHALTGLYCPGCGTARGLHKLLHGDVAGAFRMNALTMCLIPLILVLLLIEIWPRRDGAFRRPWSMPSWTLWLLAGVIVAFAVARNIPHYPFTLLAPH